MPAKVASWLLLAAVALAPLPFGSTEPTAIAFWCVVLGVCLALAPVRELSSGQLALALAAGVIIVAYALVLHEQLAERPWLARADRIWQGAENALGVPLRPSVSIARDQPWYALGRPLACMLAIACGFLIGAEEVRALQLMKVIGWSGAAYAAYGIFAHLVDPTHILGLEKKAYLASVTGTFINRNTAAAYFGSCAVVWSLLLWERVRLELPRGPLDSRAVTERLLIAAPREMWIRFAMMLLCISAMFMTGSRAGVVLSLLALVLAFSAYFGRHLGSGRLIAVACAGAVALVLLALMGGRVNERFDLGGLVDESRLATYHSTLRMITDHPWFGTGQGTFAYAFPAYRSPNVSIWGTWDMAHNSLLEIAAEMGVPIAALVVVGWLVIFAVLIRGASVRRRALIVPVAALCVALLAVVHSLIDFSLQIPGYAIVALSLVGAGLSQSFPSHKSQAIA